MVAIARPSLKLTITPPGGAPTDYSSNFCWDGVSQQFTINQNFGRQGDTATIPLVDEYVGTPHFYIPVMSQIQLYDNNLNQTLFAGVVNDPTLTPTGPNRNEWSLKCTDYTYYADNSTPVFGPDFNGFTADKIVIALTEQADCGITAAPVAQGGFVAPGVVLPSVAVPYQSLSAAWRMLAQLASQVTPYGWYVDENLALHFYDSTTAIDSGVTFTTSPTVAGSTTEGHITLDTQFAYEWDGTTVHNRILVQGGSQTIYSVTFGPPTDVWQGNGVQTAWPLRFTFSGIGRFLVNNVQTVVTQLSPGEPPDGTANWYVQQNSTGAWFLTANTAPAPGTTIKFWYNYQIPIVAQVNDYGSQAAYTGPNRGIFGEYVSDSSLSTQSMAMARAMRERQEYSFAAERVTFNTSPDFLGYVRSGEIFTMDNQFIPDSQTGYSWGLTDTFILTQNRVSFANGGYRQMTMTGVRV